MSIWYPHIYLLTSTYICLYYTYVYIWHLASTYMSIFGIHIFECIWHSHILYMYVWMPNIHVDAKYILGSVFVGEYILVCVCVLFRGCVLSIIYIYILIHIYMYMKHVDATYILGCVHVGNTVLHACLFPTKYNAKITHTVFLTIEFAVSPRFFVVS